MKERCQRIDRAMRESEGEAFFLRAGKREREEEN